MKQKLIFTALLTFLFVNNFFGQTRDPFLYPFTSESVWNMPIHRDAWKEGNYEDANIDIIGVPSRFKAEGVQIFLEDTANPREEYHRVRWTDRCTNHHHYKDNYIHFPSDYIWNGWENSQRNSTWAMIKSDSSTIWDATLLTRCDTGLWVGGAWFAPDRPYSIYGSGAGKVIQFPDQDEDIWGHGAAKMSALGGTIRKGELSTPEDHPIRHALKFTINTERYLASCEVFGGKPFVWPAQGADGHACDLYAGTNKDFVMGTLLALPPDITKEELGITTHEGRKIFDALQNYGGYVVEGAGWDNWQFLVEEAAIQEDWPAGDHSSIMSGVFFDELQTMIGELHIIKLNNPDNIAGGPTSDHDNRMAPVACEIGEFGSGKSCPLDPVVSIISPINNSTIEPSDEIMIEAHASDGDGEIDTVGFYVNDKLIGIDTSAPYTISWNETENGKYKIKAVATDNTGSKTTSIEVKVWLGNQPPTVDLISPQAGNIFFEDEKITIQAEAFDNDGSVDKVFFYANDIEIAADPYIPYALIWSPTEASEYKIQAVAVDDKKGKDSTSQIVKVYPFFNYGEQQFLNPGFDSPDNIWEVIHGDVDGTSTEIISESGNKVLKAYTDDLQHDNWAFGIKEKAFYRALEGNTWYELDFYAKTASSQNLDVIIQAGQEIIIDQHISLSDSFQHYSFPLLTTTRGEISLILKPEDPTNPTFIDNAGLIKGVKPTIGINAEDTLYIGQEAEIAAQALDKDGNINSVEFYIDDNLMYVDNTMPYSFHYTPEARDEGSITIHAVANDNHGLKREAEQHIHLSFPLSIRQLSDTYNSIKVFPNPSSGKIFIENRENEEIISFEFFDAQGRKLLQITPPTGRHIEIDRSLISGRALLFLKIKTRKNTIIKKIILKQ